MSKKTIPFKVTPTPVEIGTAKAVPGNSSAEAWVQKQARTPEDSGSLPDPRFSGRSIFVLSDNPTWVEVVLSATLIPPLAWWLWALTGLRTAFHDR
jgi:hypothetical protein